ncbi:MAG TPA: histidine kinase [Terracidiphilus sp.]|nr:histidine kinase [Terracidiphilus sp.]
MRKPNHYPGHTTLFVVWQLLAVVSYVRYAIEAGATTNNLVRDLLDWSTCYYPWFLLTPLLFRLERRFPLGEAGWAKNLIVLATISLPMSWLAYATTIVFDSGVSFAFHRSPLATDKLWPMPLREVVLEQALYWTTVGAACVIRKLIELREKERLAAQLALEKLEIEASLRRSELEMLRMRLNPHFLFNSLQNISALARRDPDAASQMLARLGDVLRAALRKGGEAQTTLAAEIALTKAYIAVEQIRFAGRLSVLFEIEPELESAEVPGFLLQPLVENAMTHGLRGIELGGTIWVRGIRENSSLVLTVRDNGSGPSAESIANLEMGIGLGSTCERLDRMYPGHHSLSLQRLPEGGTEVRIVLPLEWDSDSKEKPPHELSPVTHRR